MSIPPWKSPGNNDRQRQAAYAREPPFRGNRGMTKDQFRKELEAYLATEYKKPYCRPCCPYDDHLFGGKDQPKCYCFIIVHKCDTRVKKELGDYLWKWLRFPMDYRRAQSMEMMRQGDLVCAPAGFPPQCVYRLGPFGGLNFMVCSRFATAVLKIVKSVRLQYEESKKERLPQSPFYHIAAGQILPTCEMPVMTEETLARHKEYKVPASLQPAGSGSESPALALTTPELSTPSTARQPIRDTSPATPPAKSADPTAVTREGRVVGHSSSTRRKLPTRKAKDNQPLLNTGKGRTKEQRALDDSDDASFYEADEETDEWSDSSRETGTAPNRAGAFKNGRKRDSDCEPARQVASSKKMAVAGAAQFGISVNGEPRSFADPTKSALPKGGNAADRESQSPDIGQGSRVGWSTLSEHADLFSEAPASKGEVVPLTPNSGQAASALGAGGGIKIVAEVPGHADSTGLPLRGNDQNQALLGRIAASELNALSGKQGVGSDPQQLVQHIHFHLPPAPAPFSTYGQSAGSAQSCQEQVSMGTLAASGAANGATPLLLPYSSRSLATYSNPNTISLPSLLQNVNLDLLAQCIARHPEIAGLTNYPILGLSPHPPAPASSATGSSRVRSAGTPSNIADFYQAARNGYGP